MREERLKELRQKLNSGDYVVDIQLDDEESPQKGVLVTKQGYGYDFLVLSNE